MRARTSAALFVLGVLLAPIGLGLLLAGGSQCGSPGSSTMQAVVERLTADCGGISAWGGLLALLTAAAMLWWSRTLQPR